LAHDLGAIRVAFADGPKHRSVNAGWPEAAMAAALGLSLSGPRSYAGRMTDDAALNPAGTRAATPGDIAAAIRALWRVWAALLGLTLAISLL
jgi:adenosylcobinamide-phosphate synthase